MPDNEMGLLDRLGKGIREFRADPERMARLQMGLNSMRLNPDQGIAASAANTIQRAQERRQSEMDVNATIEFLRKQAATSPLASRTLQAIQANPSLMKEYIKAYGIELIKEKKLPQVPAEIATFNAMSKNLTPEEIAKARRIKLGLTPREANQQVFLVGGVPHVVDRATQKVVPLQIDGVDITAQDIADNQNIIKSSAKISEAATAKVIDAPEAARAGNLMLDTLNKMQNEYRAAVSSRTGGIEGKLPVITEKQALGQSFIDQVAGKTFMEAYQSLKGGGQITEIESEKAEAALTRLQQREMSDEEYFKALQELQEIVIKNVQRYEKLIPNSAKSNSSQEEIIDQLVNKYAN